MISVEQNKLFILSDRNKIKLKKNEIGSDDSCSDINSNFGKITSSESSNSSEEEKDNKFNHKNILESLDIDLGRKYEIK
jgi:hypothetical protein